MLNYLPIVAVLMGLTIIGLFLSNASAKRYDLLSWRNLMLLGFVHFYCIGGYLTATRGFWDDRYVPSVEGMNKLSLGMIVFFAVFMLGNRWAYRRPLLTRIIPRFRMPVATPSVVGMIAAFISIAIVLALLPVSGYLSLLATQVRAGLVGAGVGLATYYVIASKFNPISWLLFSAVLPLGAVVSTVGTSGRRFLLSALLVVAWVWWYQLVRYKHWRFLLTRIAPVGAASLFIILVYGSIRHQGRGEDFDIRQRVNQVQDALDTSSLQGAEYVLFTDTTGNTVFIFDSYPDPYGFQPLAGFVWLITNPVPRFFWGNKPEALGVVLQDQMDATANLGPGIIGHGWAEAGWLGIIYYALFFGIITGIFDRSLVEEYGNPFFQIVVGCLLGNVIAMTRGDTPLFVIQMMAGTTGVILVYIAGRILLGPLAAVSKPLTVSPPELRGYFEDQHDAYSYEDHHEDHSYGDEHHQQRA